MMTIKVYSPKCKIEKAYKEAINEYDKRLSRYCKMSSCSIKDEKQLMGKIQPNDYLIQIRTEGQVISSEALSEHLEELAIKGYSSISFIIGFPAVTDANETLSLSPMTMSHGLEYTVLYEQIYRAYRIMHNHSYHK